MDARKGLFLGLHVRVEQKRVLAAHVKVITDVLDSCFFIAATVKIKLLDETIYVLVVFCFIIFLAHDQDAPI